MIPPVTDARWNLSAFSGAGYDIGRTKRVQVAWLLVSGSIFTRWWCPASLRVAILRAFGANIGADVLIRHRVRIHWPWKLTVGDSSWVGEGAWLLNLEPITIGANVCISQEAMLCTGSHDQDSPSFEFNNESIVVEDGAWICARAIILRGTTIRANQTIGAGQIVYRSAGRVNPPGDSEAK